MLLRAHFRPAPPLNKPCGSGIDPWLSPGPTPTADPGFGCFLTILADRCPTGPRKQPRYARAFVPLGPKPYAIGLGSRRLRRRPACDLGLLPDLCPRSLGPPAVANWRIFVINLLTASFACLLFNCVSHLHSSRTAPFSSACKFC